MKYSKRTLSRIINGDITPVEKPGKPDKTRLDLKLLELHPEYNRSTLKKFIENGQVKVNNKITEKANYLLLETDKIKFTPPKTPEKPKIKILYEDENVIVIDKPAGLLTMSKGAFNPEPTVADFVGGEQNLVHRLDRDTSGVLIAAKNPETKKFLQKQFENRKTKKTYHAIVTGTPEHQEAIIKLPIARNLKKPTTFMVDKTGREAITHYKVLRSNGKLSAIELKPATGRTHQLRVHLAYLKTPILGDKVYGDQKSAKTAKSPRMYLHASELELTIPGGSKEKNQRKVFTSEIPEDFNNVL